MNAQTNAELNIVDITPKTTFCKAEELFVFSLIGV